MSSATIIILLNVLIKFLTVAVFVLTVHSWFS